MGNSISKYAIIIFTDIIDSSRYSAILGIEQFAESILTFQNTFEKVSNEYFRNNKNLEGAYLKCKPQGDEGLIFIVPDEKTYDPTEIIYLAVHYAFELKARLSINFSDDISMKKMQIATGIHLGMVATVKDDKVKEVSPENIDKIVGYNINYAKRIESSARFGKYSRVFLSKAASSFLPYKPVVLEKHEVDLKGISQLEDVFEVRSAFCKDLKIDTFKGDELELFSKKFISGIGLDLLEEPWLKSYVISVLESIRKRQTNPAIEKKYDQKISDFIWEDQAEDDPIVLFVRALHCGDEKKHSRRVSILKEIIEKYPSFVFAKRQLIKAISDISDQSHLSSEFVYARDIASELLDKYPKAVGGEAERIEFEKIIERLNRLIGGS